MINNLTYVSIIFLIESLLLLGFFMSTGRTSYKYLSVFCFSSICIGADKDASTYIVDCCCVDGIIDVFVAKEDCDAAIKNG